MLDASLTLILTARCNLSCAYCYQNAKRARSISWPTLNLGLRQALAAGSEPFTLHFYGGEPLLEFPLMQRAVRFIEERRGRQEFAYELVTNGLLFDEEILSFLDQYSFEVQLSFDGVRVAQNLRGKDTFQILDRNIEAIRREHPRLFSRKLTIRVTVSPDSVGYLSQSVAYFIQKGVKDVRLSPVFNAPNSQSHDYLEKLESQFSNIAATCDRHWQETGTIPVALFRSTGYGQAADQPMCGIVDGKPKTLDVDGEVYACVMLVPSYQNLEGPLWGEWRSLLRLGHISDEDLDIRSEATAQLMEVDLLVRKERKYSTYSRCVDCEFFNRCFICPISTAHVPGNTDPNHVSDFICAFKRTSFKYQKIFADAPFKRLREAVERQTSQNP